MTFSEQLREIAKEEMTKLIMRNLDSAVIFKYIQGIEQENKQLKEQNEKFKIILSKVRKDEDLTIDEKITMEELER